MIQGLPASQDPSTSLLETANNADSCLKQLGAFARGPLSSFAFPGKDLRQREVSGRANLDEDARHSCREPHEPPEKRARKDRPHQVTTLPCRSAGAICPSRSNAETTWKLTPPIDVITMITYF